MSTIFELVIIYMLHFITSFMRIQFTSGYPCLAMLQKMSKMLGPFSGLNSVLVGGHQSGSVIRGRTTSQR